MQPLSTGQTFSTFLSLNAFHSCCTAAAIPCDVTLQLRPAPLTPSLSARPWMLSELFCGYLWAGGKPGCVGLGERHATLLAKLEEALSDLTNICFREEPNRPRPAPPPSSQGRGAMLPPSAQSPPSWTGKHLT